MIFTPTELPGVLVVDLERHVDDRGFFARTWCRDELARRGLVGELAQSSVSFNRRAGTLRGMHYQCAPHEETKLVTCLRGRIYDVTLDLRRESPTYRRWFAAELSGDDLRSIYVPAGCAHGFQTLSADALVHYQISVPYSPAHARGVRWNDPAFGIEWPPAERTMSQRDASYEDYV
jgi:dTDP-4-dehydrorhamnose 3,5-epimerase